MRVRLPIVVNASVKKWNLRAGFVEAKDFPRDVWFKTMDRIMEMCELHSVHDDIDTVFGIVFSLLKDYQALADYLINDPHNVDLDDDTWEEATKAMAFLIIQRYNREVDKGSWVVNA